MSSFRVVHPEVTAQARTSEMPVFVIAADDRSAFGVVQVFPIVSLGKRQGLFGSMHQIPTCGHPLPPTNFPVDSTINEDIQAIFALNDTSVIRAAGPFISGVDSACMAF